MTRARAWVLVQATITVALLALLMRTLDLAALAALFASLPLTFYLTSLAVVLAGQIAYAWRWRLLLTSAGVTVSFSQVVRQYFVGIFVNNFLPSSVGGDVAKVYYLGRAHGFRVIAASVAVDRLLGIVLLAGLASAALWISPITVPRLMAASIATAAIAIASLLLLVLIGVGTGGLPGRVARLGSRAVQLAERLQRLRLDMAAPLRRPSVIMQAALIVVGYAVVVTAVYLRFVTLQHVPTPPFVAMFAAVTATAVLSNVPISLNGLGLREQLHAAFLAPLGVAPEIAVAISILLYTHLLIASLIGMVFWLRPAGSDARITGTSAP
jgi:glycosyltransferase 2 family protein